MAQDEDAKAEQAEPEGEQPKGGPDWQRAAQDYKAQRDEARQRVADLTAQYDALKKDVEGLKTSDDVQKAVDAALEKANAEFERAKADWAGRELDLTARGALVEAGCIDPDAAMAHVDRSALKVEGGKLDGLDADSLKASYPYLFGMRAQSGATDARPDGAADGGLDARIDAAFDKGRVK